MPFIIIILTFAVYCCPAYCQVRENKGTHFDDFIIENHPWIREMFANGRVNQYDSTNSRSGLWVVHIGFTQQRNEDYEIGIYEKGQKEGTWRHFVNDRIISQCDFKNGVPHGYFVCYNSDGRICAMLQISDGNIEGNGHFFEHGLLVGSVCFEKGFEYKIFYEIGKSMSYIKVETFFKDFESWKH